MQNIGNNIRFEPSQNENNIKRVKVIRKSDLEDSNRYSNTEDYNRHSNMEGSDRYYDNHDGFNDSRPKSNRNSNAYGSKSRVDRAFEDYNPNNYSNNYPNDYDDQYYHDDLSSSSYDYDDSYSQANNQPVRLNKQSYREDNYNSKKSRFNRKNRKNKNNYNQNNYNNKNKYDSSNDHYQNSYNQRENNSNHYEESKKDKNNKKNKKDKNNDNDQNDLFAKHSRKFKRS